MADDNNTTKNMDINDLVRELSKSPTSPVPPSPSPAPQAPRPAFPSPPPPITPFQPKPSEMPRPQFNAPPRQFDKPMPTDKQAIQPKPAPTAPTPTMPTPAVPLPTPGVKEYQSSIRTMNEDISRLKQGQKPTGIDVPRKVEQVVPAPVTPSPTKPVIPSPQLKVPSVNLGETQKTGPIAQSKDVSKPPAIPKVEPKPQIYIPQEGQKGGNRNMLFIGIGAAAIVAGFSYWFFVLRLPASDFIVELPTPVPTAMTTPTPVLSDIFANLENQTVCTSECTPSSFFEDINEQPISGGQFKFLYFSENNTLRTIAQLFDDFKLVYPGSLKGLLGEDRGIFVYGQKEIFDQKGLIRTDSIVEKRLVLINEATDSIAVSQLLKEWETDMPNNLREIFLLELKRQTSQAFSDNFYRGVSIRYQNFAYSDKSIDYAVVAAPNGKSYLVIAGSREAMYATIDKLLGF
ncbi:MAG: hypothetical protein A2915_00200 [Candidatus Yanofskybacteria bacterium RIFCSPLOWO2_01_FULL_41_34]|uniref:Uncharacterized protein n=1 Tax=Candidatus Yanofskybacteria bacterium RIFCSPHIGHO2_01_FULL_41_26 TaxID=1802661 RepID=A0A1F8EEE0_9BACT|nr:MAG: hypothetical protein A2649_02130 [Candidatus Yanofskybacteria bacterium RIFCSPHIGHO2_01_FULL_41_26]OGN21243.1 MAG: hypothetical protein A2915_00200 [Candidatus Yanofskybacteria bacterium RIFCSPLOWO2_01_FULL_41_34]